MGEAVGRPRAHARGSRPPTVDRETFERANAMWKAGSFDPAWAPYRAALAEKGFIWPPDGTPDDDVDDDPPSPRSIIWQAIEERPKELLKICRESDDWHEVIREVLVRRAALREQLEAAEAAERAEKAARVPSRVEATEALRVIIRRIA